MSKLIIKAINNPWQQEEKVAQRLNRLKSLAFNFTEVEFMIGSEFFLANFTPVKSELDYVMESVGKYPSEVKHTIAIFTELSEVIRLLNAKTLSEVLLGVNINEDKISASDLEGFWEKKLVPALEHAQINKDLRQLMFEFVEEAEQIKFVPQFTNSFFFLTEIRREKLFHKLRSNNQGLNLEELRAINEDLSFWVKLLEQELASNSKLSFSMSQTGYVDALRLELAAAIYFKIILILKDFGVMLSELDGLLLPALLKILLEYNDEDLVYNLLQNYLTNYEFKSSGIEELDLNKVSDFILC